MGHVHASRRCSTNSRLCQLAAVPRTCTHEHMVVPYERLALGSRLDLQPKPLVHAIMRKVAEHCLCITKVTLDQKWVAKKRVGLDVVAKQESIVTSDASGNLPNPAVSSLIGGITNSVSVSCPVLLLHAKHHLHQLACRPRTCIDSDIRRAAGVVHAIRLRRAVANRDHAVKVDAGSWTT